EFLLVDDLDLPPVGRTLARFVERVGVLGDEPFPAALQRLLVQRAPVAADDFAQAQHRRFRVAEDALERGAPLGPRTVAVIGPPVAKKIEGDEGYGGSSGSGGSGGSGGSRGFEGFVQV